MCTDLDDMTIWDCGGHATETIRAALDLRRKVDSNFVLEEHPNKRELFSNTKHTGVDPKHWL